MLIGLIEGSAPSKLPNREINFEYFGSSSNFMLITVSRNSLKGAGQKQQSISGDVAIFFLQTRNDLLSPCNPEDKNCKKRTLGELND